MTNADFLLSAEKIYQVSPGGCVLSCRRCLETAMTWMPNPNVSPLPRRKDLLRKVSAAA